jgi:hypothetical protein
MNGNATDAIVSRLTEKARAQENAEKIKAAFPCLTDAAVGMLLRGLRAEGIMSVDEWLNQQPLPRKGSKEATIDRLIAEGLRPPTNIRWTPFCNRVRDEGDGWTGKGAKRKPRWGFQNRTIQNYVRGVR